MEIHWCLDEQIELYKEIYADAKEEFNQVLADFNIMALEIYVVGDSDDAFRCKVHELYKHNYGRNDYAKNNVSGIMASCIDIEHEKYVQIMIIRFNIFFVFLYQLKNNIEDYEACLISRQLVYHEFCHLWEMKLRHDLGLGFDWKNGGNFEYSKVIWSEYFAERKSLEMFTKSEVDILCLEKKFDRYKNFSGDVNYSDFMYHLVHYLACKWYYIDEAIELLFENCNYSYLSGLIMELNKTLKEMYKGFPQIKFISLMKIKKSYEEMVSLTTEYFDI